MLDPDIRPATAGDVEQLRTLEREARAALVGRRGGDRWLETHAPRNDRWEDAVGANGVEVAVIGDIIVGYLVSRHAEHVAFIEEVYITPEAREVGFGDALVAAAMAAGRAAGCAAIEGEALPGDRDVKNLYERAGITARLIIVSKAL